MACEPPTMTFNFGQMCFDIGLNNLIKLGTAVDTAIDKDLCFLLDQYKQLMRYCYGILVHIDFYQLWWFMGRLLWRPRYVITTVTRIHGTAFAGGTFSIHQTNMEWLSKSFLWIKRTPPPRPTLLLAQSWRLLLHYNPGHLPGVLPCDWWTSMNVLVDGEQVNDVACAIFYN